MGEGDLRALRRRYLSGMAARIPPEHRGSRWLVDKALNNAWYVGHIARLMPRACVVHAVRHPADAALSAFQQSFYPDKVPWSFALPSAPSGGWGRRGAAPLRGRCRRVGGGGGVAAAA